MFTKKGIISIYCDKIRVYMEEKQTMKIKYVQISDLHIKSSTSFDNRQITNLVDIAIINCPDIIMLLLSGDIANSGNKDEYSRASSIVEKICKEIKQKINCSIYVICVPGNHDIAYEKEFSRKREDIAKMTLEFQEKNLSSELKRFENYYDFEEKMMNMNTDYLEIEKFDTINEKIIKKTNIDMSNNNCLVSFYQLNDSCYTYVEMGEVKEYDNEKGLLRISPSFFDKISYSNNSINILLMHFPIEYFDDQSRDLFLDFLKSNINIVFTGHLHTNLSYKMLDEQNNTIFISSEAFNTGQNKKSGFNVVSHDLDQQNISIKAYSWNQNRKFYDCVSGESVFSLPTIYKSINMLQLKRDFLNDLLKDEMNISSSSLDYFVFPKLSNKINQEDDKRAININNFDDFLVESSKFQYISIIGDESSGKTEILKYIHSKLTKSHVVLYLNSDIIDGKRNFSVLIKNLFFNQYDVVSIEQFDRIPMSQRILIIDDIDQVKNNDSLLTEAGEKFGKIIFSRNKTQSLNLVDFNNLEDAYENTITFLIEGFYKSKREELIRKVYSLLCVKNGTIFKENDYTKFSKKLSNIVETNLTLFSLNPFMIILMIKHLFFFNIDDEKNVFNEVFMSNITQQINFASVKIGIKSLNPYFQVLQKIAYEMNRNSLNCLQIEDIARVVSAYNEKYDQEIETISVVELLIKARVTKVKNNCYYFTNKNYLAYFASREYVRMSNHFDDHICEFDNLMNNLFDGVNDKILLFMAVSQQNDRIITNILENAEKLFATEKEMDLDNFEFLTKSSELIGLFKPITAEDRKKRNQLQEKNEKEISEKEQKNQQSVFHNIDFTDYEKKFYNGLNYIKLISTIFPTFAHSLDAPTQKRIVSSIYTLSNKLLLHQFKFLDENKEDIIDYLYEKIKNQKPNLNETIPTELIKDKIYLSLVDLVRATILNVYHMAARRSVDLLTEKKLDTYFTELTGSHKIQKIMFKSFSISEEGDKNFREATMKLYKKVEEDKNILLMNCIKLIVRRYVLESETITFYGNDQKFLRVFFNDSSIKTFLTSKFSKKSK